MKKSKSEVSALLPYLQKGRIEAGCDEAGRGCLAGPVFAAAVILPEGYSNPMLNDSKQISEKKRVALRQEIEHVALAYAVIAVSPKEIDQINILNASIVGMQRAVLDLKVKPEFLLIDGNRFKPMEDFLHQCIIKGDGKYQSIAAASVLAKTYRDEYMGNLHEKFPVYNWNSNKGYPTKKHREAIALHGITEHHRNSFKLFDRQTVLPFPEEE